MCLQESKGIVMKNSTFCESLLYIKIAKLACLSLFLNSLQVNAKVLKHTLAEGKEVFTELFWLLIWGEEWGISSGVFYSKTLLLTGCVILSL